MNSPASRCKPDPHIGKQKISDHEFRSLKTLDEIMRVPKTLTMVIGVTFKLGRISLFISGTL